MRKKRYRADENKYSILTLDDDPIMTETIQSYFQPLGYRVDIENDPYAAIERIRVGNYDILLLDFLMTPICGDQVVEQIRTFNQDLFIILLTGHKSMVPPIRTIRALDIQGYYEKSDRFDQLELLVESCIKSIDHMRTIKAYQKSLAELANALPEIYSFRTADALEAPPILKIAKRLWTCTSGFLAAWSETVPRKLVRYAFGKKFEALDGMTPQQLLGQIEAMEETGLCMRTLLQDTDGNAVGVLALETQKKPGFYQERLFEIFSRQCASALENNALMTRVKTGYLEVIQALRLMVDAKDIYTRGHSDRVAYYAVQLAVALGKEEKFCERVQLAGLLHDIGKMAVPDEILLAERRLTNEELDVIRKHPQYGCSILSAITHFREIVPIVRSHHERYGGGGYPDGLIGEEIPEESRIISIADAFDAMTSTRRYRSKMTFEEAAKQLRDNKDIQFDGAMVDVFLALIPKLPKEEIALTERTELFAERIFKL